MEESPKPKDEEQDLDIPVYCSRCGQPAKIVRIFESDEYRVHCPYCGFNPLYTKK